MQIKLTLILFAAAILLIGCQSNEENEEVKSIPVKVFEIKPETISKTIKLTGGLTAYEDVILYSKISEKFEKIYVKAGDKVNKGQILAVQYNALLKQVVEAAEASLKNAGAQLNLVLQEYERIERLHKQNAVSQQQFEQALTQKKAAEAVVEQSQAMLRQAEEQYENSFVKAPFEGIIAAVYFEINQMAPAGQPVIQLIGSAGMKAKLKVTPKDIPFIKKGQNVAIKFPSIYGVEFYGKVSSVNQAVDQLTKALEIEVQLISNDSRLKSGLFGEFYIEVNSKPNTIAIPEKALLRQTEVIIDRNTGIQTPMRKHFVFTVKDRNAALVEVEPGISSNGRIEIIRGLNNGDTVIVVGQNIVKEGQKVNVVE